MVTTLLSCVLGVRQFFSLLAFIAREEIAQFVDSGMQGWRRTTRLLPSNRLPVRLQLLFYQMPWSNHQAWLTIIFEFLGNRSRQYADCSTTSNLDVRAIPRYGESMNLNVQIPDDLARSLNAAGGDLTRHVIEALALEEYRSGRLTVRELRQALGFATGYELDGFLKKHQIWMEYDEQDLARERAALDSFTR